MICASFDLDGVLVNSIDIIQSELEKYGYIIDNDGGDRSFNFSFKNGFSPPEDFLWDLFFYRLFTEKWQYINPVDDHVVEFMSRVYESGNSPIQIITSRPSGAFIHHCTMLSLKKCFPEIEFSVNVVSNSDNKHRWMFGTDVIFEDRRRTAIKMSGLGCIVFLRSTNYNKLPDNVSSKRIQDIDVLFGEVRPGDIITFENYEQLLENGMVEEYLTI